MRNPCRKRRRCARAPCCTWGNRAAVDQALSRLAKSGELLRVCQGVYMRPIETRFGLRNPSTRQAVRALSELWERNCGPMWRGSRQCPRLDDPESRPADLPDLGAGPRTAVRKLKLLLRHAPRWQLVAPNRPAGAVVRALSWLHREEAEEALRQVLPNLSEEDQTELLEVAGGYSDLDGAGRQRGGGRWLNSSPSLVGR